MADLEKQRWERMLKWLSQTHGMDTSALAIEARETPGAGRGLFATSETPAGSVLFKIPSGALMNALTVHPLYPQLKEAKLSGAQLVSLHLLLHKPLGEQDSLDPTFGPYISTLPRDFSSHPLTWFVKRRIGREEACGSYFLDNVPPSTWQAIVKLSERFWKDWEAVSGAMKENPTLIARSTRPDMKTAKLGVEGPEVLLDYLWAWLNVNTRCIYYRIRQSQSDPDNFTLCPILDFANHGPGQTEIFPVLNSDIWGYAAQQGKGNARRGKADSYTFLGPSDRTLSKGSELLLKYGAHSNRFLFTEYGFVNAPTKGAVSSSSYSGEVDLQELVEELIDKAGSARRLIRTTLEDTGYWGEWTLDGGKDSAHPSWRLLSALRLLCALERYPGEVTVTTRLAIDSWKDVTNGVKDKISDTNEKECRLKLLWLCETVRVRAQKDRLSGLKAVVKSAQARPGWVTWMSETVDVLWREELEVAEAVIERIHAGEEF